MGMVSLALAAGVACVFLLPVPTATGAAAAPFCAKPTLGASATGETLLGVDREAVRAGGEVRLRIENFGQDPVGWGLPYGLDRWNRATKRWIEIPSGRLFSSIQLWVDAGTASQCQVIDVGPRFAPGPYRVQKRVTVGFPGTPAILTGGFRVAPAPSPGR